MVADRLFVKLPLLIVVRGEPVPQGSKSAFVIKPKDGGKPRAVITEDANKSPAARESFKLWRSMITEAAREALNGQEPMTGAVGFRATFTLRRPKGHYGTGRNAAILRPAAPRRPTGKPDDDKLARAVKDALTAAGVYRDDAQIVSSHVDKVYPQGRWAGPGTATMTLPDPTILCGDPVGDALDTPGVVIRVWDIG